MLHKFVIVSEESAVAAINLPVKDMLVPVYRPRTFYAINQLTELMPAIRGAATEIEGNEQSHGFSCMVKCYIR